MDHPAQVLLLICFSSSNVVMNKQGVIIFMILLVTQLKQFEE